METITSKNGLLIWNVVSSEMKQTPKRKRLHYTVVCPECGYQTSGETGNIKQKIKCPGCSAKPHALKTDSQGSCIALCDIGTVEFIREYQNEHSVSERVAVRYFVETVKANLSPDDPVSDSLTVESVRASVRRATGKKKDNPLLRGELPQDKKEKVKKYRIEPEVTAVQTFLKTYLPDYMLVKVKSGLNEGATFTMEPSSKC